LQSITPFFVSTYMVTFSQHPKQRGAFDAPGSNTQMTTKAPALPTAKPPNYPKSQCSQEVWAVLWPPSPERLTTRYFSPASWH
jgi:hypothetical protein